ncbi:transcription termination factor NusA [Patescibacteria group bacterium]|nr:transcription termination factor NusA [Patescibacteria group bacterium]MBU1500432.1 transcription termination factor NusA [Patescibacteria group bacterium]MBU2080500.1 transcription termination factor NusA [Patescibacteria group bacterium]MBU2123695.1 transcription termination factor NusA [Patescibacteria group bacterium]MBU2194551.1 transcription termination factor NusA [Patescibacteria group bacterium]
MLDLKTINSVLGEFEERGITKETMVDAIEQAMATAYKKEYGKRGQVVRGMLDMDTGTVSFEQVKTIVDDTMVRFPEEGEEELPEAHPHYEREEVVAEGELPRYDAEKHILIEDAKRIKRDAEVGQELIFPLEPQDDFGRIAAQTAKQVVIQKIREAEKLSILDEFGHKKGEIVTGIVQRAERGAIFVDLGRATGIIPYEEQIPGERYRTGERISAYLYAVDEGFRGVYLRLSRSHPRFLTRLFEMEVPELASGAIEVKGLAREPGSRTKIAIASLDPHVDPVGSLVGQRGVRVSTVMAALGGERIDIIEWSEDQAAFIKESLSPATVLDVEIDEEGHRATVTVSEDQQSLAIGRGGQNVRLAAKLTGWNIDIAAVGGESVADSGNAAAVEGASDESVAATEAAEDMDPAVAAGIDPTESESVVTEEAPANNTLSMEEETTQTDDGNESVSDAEEARDEA